MLWIFRDRYRARGARKKIQVIDVVARARHHSVISAVNQDRIAISGLEGALASVFSRIQVVEGKSVGMAKPVVVDFIQIHLGWRIVSVMFVGRIA